MNFPLKPRFSSGISQPATFDSRVQRVKPKPRKSTNSRYAWQWGAFKARLCRLLGSVTWLRPDSILAQKHHLVTWQTEMGYHWDLQKLCSFLLKYFSISHPQMVGTSAKQRHIGSEAEPKMRLRRLLGSSTLCIPKETVPECCSFARNHVILMWSCM